MRMLSCLFASVVAMGSSAGFGAPTSRSYVQNGLVAQWDGIDNAVDESGNRYHDPAATVWADLSGNGHTLGNFASDVTWSTNAFVTPQVKYKQAASFIGVSVGGSDYQSYEIVLALDSELPQVGCVVFGFGNFKGLALYREAKERGFKSETSTAKLFRMDYDVSGKPQQIYADYNNGGVSDTAYVDGVKSATQDRSSSWTQSASCIGYYSNDNWPFYGRICALRLYSRKLSEEERLQNLRTDCARFFGDQLNGDLLPVPGAVTLEEPSDSMLRLKVSATWHLGSDPDTRLLFVDWRKRGDEAWQTRQQTGDFSSASCSDLEVLLTGLAADTEYEVRLRAQSTFGGDRENEAVGEAAVFATAVPNANPALRVDAARPAFGETGLELPVAIDSIGTGASRLTALKLAVGSQEGAYDYEESVPVDGLAVGDVKIPVVHFSFGETHFVRLVAENDVGGRFETTFSFVVPDETFGSTCLRGLWQVKFLQGYNVPVCDGKLAELTDDPDCFDVMGVPVGEGEFDRQCVEGAIVSTIPWGSSPLACTSAKTGRTYVLENKNVYGYSGYVFLEAEKTYVFGGRFIDSSRSYIDGTQVHYQPVWNTYSEGSYFCERTGWHRIDVYVGHSSGGGGSSDNLGFVWRESGKSNRQLMDSDDSVLLAGLVDGATESKLAFVRFARRGNRLIAVVRMTDPLLTGCRFSVYAGERFGAMTKMAGMTELESTDGEFAFCDMEVPADVNYVRFVAEKECFGGTALCWAPAVRWAETEDSDVAPPLVVSAEADCHVAAGDVEIVGSVFSVGAGTTVTVTLDGDERTATVDGRGGFSAAFSGLDETQTHTASVRVTDEEGEHAIDLKPFAFERESIFPSAFSLALARERQRALVVRATVETLGVGKTEAILLTGPDADHLVEVACQKLSSAGEVRFDLADLPWDSTLVAKVVFEVTSGGTVDRIETSCQSHTVADAATYTWKSSVAAGDWSDPDNWTPSVADCIGYPISSSSIACFEASDSKIRVDARYSIQRVVFSTARVELWSEDTNSCSLTTADHLSPGDSARLVFNHLRFDDGSHNTLNVAGSIVVTNGSTFVESGLSGHGGSLSVVDGSTLVLRSSGKNDGASSLVIDDATVRISGSYSLKNSSIRFRGRSPRMEIAGAESRLGAQSSSGSGGALFFEIPGEGYVAVPLVGCGTRYEMLGNGDPGWVTVTVTGEDGAQRLRHQPLIVWDGGIAAESLAADVSALSDGCGIEFSEKSVPEYRPWRPTSEGLAVKAVGFHGLKLGLSILIR